MNAARIVPLYRTQQSVAETITDDELAWRALGCNGTCDKGRRPCTCGINARRATALADDDEPFMPLTAREARYVAFVLGICLAVLAGALLIAWWASR